MRIKFIGDPTFRRYHRPGDDGFQLWAGEERDVPDAIGEELIRDFNGLFVRINIDAAPIDRQIKEAVGGPLPPSQRSGKARRKA